MCGTEDGYRATTRAHAVHMHIHRREWNIDVSYSTLLVAVSRVGLSAEAGETKAN